MIKLAKSEKNVRQFHSWQSPAPYEKLLLLSTSFWIQVPIDSKMSKHST